MENKRIVASSFDWVSNIFAKPIRKKVKVVTGVDSSYRGICEIEAYGVRSEVIDY